MAVIRPQISVASLLGLVACVAINFWLFRLGALWGILGLSVTKHVVVAILCQGLGVDRPADPIPVGSAVPPPPPASPPPAPLSLPEAP